MVIHHDKFIAKISQLNSIIKDDVKFADAWEAALEKEKLNYINMLTAQNKYLCAAVSKKMIPFLQLYSKEHQLLLINMMRCETHREITNSILSQKL